MPRKRREWYPGAVYHLMSRGNRHQEIFTDQSDFEFFLILLKSAQKQYSFRIHSYCLMTNHVHFLLETGDVPIGIIMRKLLGIYASYYNNRHHHSGHLFQGRYLDHIVLDDKYFLHVSRYIHLNPVEAGMVLRPEDYKWSSYGALIGIDNQPFVTTQKVLSLFPKPQKAAYREYVEEKSAIHTEYEALIKKNMAEKEAEVCG